MNLKGTARKLTFGYIIALLGGVQESVPPPTEPVVEPSNVFASLPMLTAPSLTQSPLEVQLPNVTIETPTFGDRVLPVPEAPSLEPPSLFLAPIELPPIEVPPIEEPDPPTFPGAMIPTVVLTPGPEVALPNITVPALNLLPGDLTVGQIDPPSLQLETAPAPEVTIPDLKIPIVSPAAINVPETHGSVIIPDLPASFPDLTAVFPFQLP